MFKASFLLLAISAGVWAQFDTGPPGQKEAAAAIQKSVLHGEAAPGSKLAVIASVPFELGGAARNLYIWALALPAARPGDRFFKLGAVVAGPNHELWSSANLDLTGLAPVYIEQPGKFAQVGASADVLAAEPSVTYVHVNLYSILSGSGGIAGATDLILKIDKAAAKPDIAMNLGQTGKFDRLNVRTYSSSNIRLYRILNKEGHVVGLSVDKLSDDHVTPGDCYSVSGQGISKGCGERQPGFGKVQVPRAFDGYLKRATASNA
jgi:hypothetical protein